MTDNETFLFWNISVYYSNSLSVSITRNVTLRLTDGGEKEDIMIFIPKRTLLKLIKLFLKNTID